jgi:hypothetical protein
MWPAMNRRFYSYILLRHSLNVNFAIKNDSYIQLISATARSFGATLIFLDNREKQSNEVIGSSMPVATTKNDQTRHQTFPNSNSPLRLLEDLRSESEMSE